MKLFSTREASRDGGRKFGPTVFVGLLIALAAAPAWADIPIVTCGYVINAPGTYILTVDLNCPVSNGIEIHSSQVALKLNGHMIIGTTGTQWGIDVISSAGPTGRLDHVSITGPGLVQGFFRGIEFVRADYSQVSQVTVSRSTTTLRSVDCTFLTVTSNVLTLSQGNGLEYSGSNGVIMYNDASGNGVLVPSAGIYIDGASNTMNNNTTNGNRGDGIDIFATGSRVYSNTTNGNTGAGINILLRGGNQIFHNSSSAGNGTFDLQDNNATCDSNVWADNVFFSRNQPCIH